MQNYSLIEKLTILKMQVNILKKQRSLQNLLIPGIYWMIRAGRRIQSKRSGHE
jgi:hypothetical protein